MIATSSTLRLSEVKVRRPWATEFLTCLRRSASFSVGFLSLSRVMVQVGQPSRWRLAASSMNSRFRHVRLANSRASFLVLKPGLFICTADGLALAVWVAACGCEPPPVGQAVGLLPGCSTTSENLVDRSEYTSRQRLVQFPGRRMVADDKIPLSAQMLGKGSFQRRNDVAKAAVAF